MPPTVRSMDEVMREIFTSEGMPLEFVKKVKESSEKEEIEMVKKILEEGILSNTS